MSSPHSLPTSEQITDLLRSVIDPELGTDIVDLGMLRSVMIHPDGWVQLTISLTTSGCPLRAEIQRDVRSRIENLPGVTRITIAWDELSSEEKAQTMATARKRIAERPSTTTVHDSTRVLLIASGKGGVGKSSVTVNMATAIAARGFSVGVVDADIWGFSVPRMLGIDARLEADPTSKRIRPHRVDVGPGSLHVVSMGFLMDDEESALMWRGLILQRAVRHFFEDVQWDSTLDYLLVDMPPGTGDVQMGIAKLLPRAEALIVTTPSTSAHKVAIRAVNMSRQNYLHVAGVIENMSAFVTPAGEVFEIFGSGGGEQLAATASIPLLAQIPIEAAVCHGGDSGVPVAANGTGPAADAFRELAARIVTDVCPPVDMTSCSARLMDAWEEALAAQPPR